MKRGRILFFPRTPTTAGKKPERAPSGNPGLSGRQRRMVRLYLTATLLLSMMFTVYIWQSTKMVEIRLRKKEIEKRIDSLETGNAVLRAEISKLQALTRIEKVAKEELGMVVPKKLCYIPMPRSFLKP